MVDRRRLHVRLDLRVRQERLDLGGEDERLRRPGEVQRLDADAVTGQEQRAPARVPDADPEHPVQALDDPRAPLLVAVDDHLGVGVVGAEAVPLLDELPAQREVVVDLAVEDDLDRSVLVRHRLVGCRRQVDDRQAAEGEPDVALRRQPQAVAVRPAVHHRVPHAGEDVRVDGLRGRGREPADDSAHFEAVPPGTEQRLGIRPRTYSACRPRSRVAPECRSFRAR